MRIILVLLCLVLQACAMPRSLPSATNLDGDDSSVVVIGKIELVPPLDRRLEQKTHWNNIGEERLLTHLFMATGPEPKPVNTDMDASEFQSTLEVQWDAPFMIKAPRRRTYLNGAMAYLNVNEHERLWFPGGYYFDVPRDAAAVYIGTLRYWRDDFNNITRVEIIDQRRDIAAVLKGADSAAKVRSSLLKRVPVR
jgi:hypothetical protein